MNRILPNQLRSLFDQHVPAGLQRALVLGIAEGYSKPWTSCRESYEEETQGQAWSFTRWLAIESAILGVGKRFRNQGVDPKFVCNTGETHIRHAELAVGPFIITAACVQDRDELPRDAAYRNILAEGNQAKLFGNGQSGPEHQRVWVPLLHIPDTASKMPSAIFAAFPDGDEGFATEHIDLLARYPLVTGASEQIEDRAAPSKRVRIAEHGS